MKKFSLVLIALAGLSTASAASHHHGTTCVCDVDGETDVGGGAGTRAVCPVHGERPRTYMTSTGVTSYFIGGGAASRATRPGWR